MSYDKSIDRNRRVAREFANMDSIVDGGGHRPHATEKNLPAAPTNHAGIAERRGAGRSDSAVPRSQAEQVQPAGEPPLRAMNSMPLINRTNVRNFLLEHAAATRPHNKFTRVSEETLRDIHESIRQMLIARIHRTPSKGRTM